MANIFELFGIITIKNSEANRSLSDTASKARSLSRDMKLNGKVTVDTAAADKRLENTSGRINTLSGDLKGEKLNGEIGIKNEGANASLADTTGKIDSFSGELKGGKLDGDISVKNAEAHESLTETTGKIDSFSGELKGEKLKGEISVINAEANENLAETTGKIDSFSGELKGGKLDGDISVKNADAHKSLAETTGKIDSFSGELKGGKLEGEIGVENAGAHASLAETTGKIDGFSGELKGGKLKGEIGVENAGAHKSLAETTGKIDSFSGELKGGKLDGEISVENADAHKSIAETTGKVSDLSADLENDLSGEIEIENEEANRRIPDTQGKVETFRTKMQQGIEKAAEWAKGLAIAAAAAATAVVAGITKIVTSAAGNADQIDKLSQNMSFSTKAFQEWDYVMQLSGVDTDRFKDSAIELQQTMKDAGNGTESAIRAFHELGVQIYDTDGKFRSTEAVYQDVITALTGIENAEERAAIATEIFKSAGEEMAPVFAKSMEEIEAMKRQAEELGFILSDEDIQAGVEFQDSVTTMKKSLASIQNALGISLLAPMQEFTEWVIDKTPVIKAKLEEWEEPIQNTAVALMDGFEYLVENPEKIKSGLEIIGGAFAAWLAVSHPYVAAITAVAGAIGALVLAGADGETQTDKFKKSLEGINETLQETIITEEQKAAKGETLVDIIERIGETTVTSKEAQEEWKAAAEELIKLYPDLREQINLETGEIEGGTEALRARITEYKNLAIEQAKQKALEEEYAAVAEAYKNAARLQIDIETDKAMLDSAYDKAFRLAPWQSWEMNRYGYTETGKWIDLQTGEQPELPSPARVGTSKEYAAAYEEYYGLLARIEKNKQDAAALQSQIEYAEKRLEIAGETMDAFFAGEGPQVIAEAAEEFEAAEGALHEAADELNNAAEALASAGEVQPELAENAEKALQSELSAMSLAVPVTPVISGAAYTYKSDSRARNPLAIPEMHSHADGLDYVPYDDYPARLHRGETVLTAKEASAYRSGEGNGMIVSAINMLAGLLREIIANTGAGQQIVLDTGILAGALAGPVNQQLGTIATRQGRRN